MSGYPRIVSFVSNADRDPFEEFSDLYGVPQDVLLDLRTILAAKQPLAPYADDHVFLYFGGLIGLGRAANYPSELRYYPLDYFPLSLTSGEYTMLPVAVVTGSPAKPLEPETPNRSRTTAPGI